MTVDGKSAQRLIERLTWTVVVVLAMALPAIHFAISWQWQDAHLQAESEFHAREVTALINRNPDMWKYEAIRLDGILSNQPGGLHDSHRILDMDGKVVAQRSEGLAWPVMARSEPLMDSGVVVGFLETSQSVRPLIVRSAILALVGIGFVVTLFFLRRVYPMSALRSALDLLTRERERARVTLDSIAEGVITIDSGDRVVLLNRAAESMTGWSQAEAAGRSLGEVFRREGEVLVGRDGTRRLTEAAMPPILDEKGRSRGTVLVFRDVTEKARIEAELFKVQKLESLGILAAGIAHEIRNPLSGINISISSIEHVCNQSSGLEPDIREKIRAVAEQMTFAAVKIGAVVQRVMEFSKPVPPRMEIVDLNETIEEAIRLSASTLRKRGIAVSKALAPDLPMCRADSRLIEQVLVNLITNAYQAMEAIEEPRRMEIGSGVVDGRIVVRVSDSGPGVSTSLRRKIFDPFFTTRKDGSGIGLSFSHRIVTDHGGTLTVDTGKWGGAEFRIELPATDEKVRA